MMYGAGLNGIGCAAAGGGLLGSGWMVTGMMGLGLILTVLLIAGIVWLLASQRDRLQQTYAPQLGYAQGSVAPSATGNHPLEIVRARFARGEIDREEYDRLIAALRG